uniref:Uncharacterized protein n=1 Tax=Caenorhabditis japonica TaxID=281687 RepID=A0A8R1HPP4_CAEJA
MGSSLVSLFENRSSAIGENRFRMSRKGLRLVHNGVNWSVCVLYSVPVFANLPDQASTKMELLGDLPCPTEEFFTADVFIFVSAYNWKMYMTLATVCITAFLGVQIVFFIGCCMYYLYFKKTPTTSLQTRNRQKVFLRGSIAQGVVPLICLLIPVVYCSTSIVLNYYNSAINNLMVLMFSTHGFFTEIVILMVHRPYRRFILQLAGRKMSML